MIRNLRTLFAALFLMSLSCMTSCNRNWCDCFPTCDVQCPPICDPCQPCPPICNPCQSTPMCDTTCAPCDSACTPCATACTPCDSSCCQSATQSSGGSCDETNSYCPGDPQAFPCGTSNCEQQDNPSRCHYSNMRAYHTCDDRVVDLVQTSPEYAMVGAPYPLEIYVTALKECADIVVNQTLPSDAEFLKSDPPVTPDQNRSLRWEFPHMTTNETQKITVWLRPLKEGCCISAATVCACPQLCSYTNCVQPVLCIKKYGPEWVCLYCPLCYRIEVCNSGTGTAHDVVVVDNLPEGVTHCSGQRTLTYPLGDLCPGQSRCINIELCATSKGKMTNVACASYCNGPKCCAEWSTIIKQPCVRVTKTGPDWAYICKTVDYTITVTNPGDLVLRDVCVEDVSPSGTTVVNAPGAEICCDRAIWNIPEFSPGETRTFTVSVRSQCPGCGTNKVTVSTCSDCGECTDCAETTTCWKGLPATHMCMVETCAPVCLGDNTTFRIWVSNQGSAEDSNVRLQLNFTNELQPLSVNGPTNGHLNGQTVTFEPIEHLAPKQSVEYTVTVKGVASGAARTEAQLHSDGLTSPISSVQSTSVY